MSDLVIEVSSRQGKSALRGRELDRRWSLRANHTQRGGLLHVAQFWPFSPLSKLQTNRADAQAPALWRSRV
jgi:hypothetical protein